LRPAFIVSGGLKKAAMRFPANHVPAIHFKAASHLKQSDVSNQTNVNNQTFRRKVLTKDAAIP